mgnify:CR=1 FL=1
MSKTVTIEHGFALPRERVVAAYLEREARLAMMAATGSADPVFERSDAADGSVDIALRRTVPVDAPAMIQAVVGETTVLEQREHWQGLAQDSEAVSVDVTSQPVGQPASASAEMRIVGVDQDHCRCVAKLTVKCSVLMVGGMIEAMMIGDSEAMLRREFAWIEANA